VTSKSSTTRCFERAIALALGRPVSLDRQVSPGYLIARALRTAGNLLRGMLLVRRRIILGRGARVYCTQGLVLSGGMVRLDDHCLLDCLSTEGVKLGRNFKLGAHSRMIASGSIQAIGRGIEIGDDVGIGEFSYIGGAGGVYIGDKTIVGQYFSAHPENHVFTDPRKPIVDQGVTRKGIRVGSGCWIGAKVTLCDGVNIGDRCVVAAGSVVTQSFPSNSVIAGVPARLVKSISDPPLT